MEHRAIDRPHAGGASDLVVLDPDHPGFRDLEYRRRRNEIARLALEYRDGDPVPVAEYTADEHGVWRTVWEHLEGLHGRYACAAYRECSTAVRLDRRQIPQLATVNQVIEKSTGFRMLPVAGLVSSRTFLSYLARSVFLATQYIRHVSRPLYTPEPDVVHELVGHAATFCQPEFARLNRRFGEAALRADDRALSLIERVYWYTLEFGAVREEGELKVCGAGLLSSFGELGRFETASKLSPLDLDRVAATPYDPTDYQREIFVASSFDAMVRDVCTWLDQVA
jgi:phenylalanine-4-hydroxylase